MNVDKEKFLDLISSAFTSSNLKAIEHALDACEQRPESGQVDAFVSVRKNLLQQRARFIHNSNNTNDQAEIEFYDGKVSGINDALNLITQAEHPNE